MADSISKQTQRQIEIYKKHHDVDEVNKIIHVVLHYEKASEIVCQDLGDENNPEFNRDIIERITDILNTFPPEYKLDLDLKIDDYEGYNPNKLVESLSDYLELEHYRTQKQTKKTWILVSFLLFVGVALLLLLTILKETGVIQETLSDLILDYFLDTAACVFMWEAVSQLFIYPAEFVTTNLKVFYFFNSVKFLDKNSNVLAEADKSTIYKDLVDNSGKKKIGNIFLILTGSIHIIVGAISIANFFVEISRRQFTHNQVLAYSIIVCIVAAIQIIYGIGAMNRFRGRGPFKTFTFVLSIILLVLYAGVIASLIVAAASGMTVSASMIVSVVISVIATTMTMIGCVFTKEKKEAK